MRTTSTSQPMDRTLSVPAGFLANIQSEKAGLQRQLTQINNRLSEISGIETVCEQFAEAGAAPPLVGAPDEPAIDTPRRRGRPVSNTTERRPRAAVVAKTSGERPTPEEVVLDALDNLPDGANFIQVRDWVKDRYARYSYGPNVLRIALNRAWQYRRIASNGVIVKGMQFGGKYYSLKHMPASASLAPEKTPDTKRTGTSG